MASWLPILAGLAGLAVGVGAGAVRSEVKKSTITGIEHARDEILKEVQSTVNTTLVRLEKYERSIRRQFYTTAVSCALLCFFVYAIEFDPLVVLLVIVLKFTAMNLLADFFVLLIHNKNVGNFLQSYLRNVRERATRKCSQSKETAVQESVKYVIRKRVTGRRTIQIIMEKVSREIETMPRINRWAYDVFGDSREDIVKKIIQLAEMELESNYETICSRISYIVQKIIKALATFGLVAMVLRWGVPELAGIGWWTWLILPLMFIICYFWHSHKVKA